MNRLGREENTALVDIVIVNWNAGSLLKTCLQALAESTIVERLNVVVVDNASSDQSLQAIGAPRIHFEIIRNATNRGFAAACNQGAASSQAPYILFLNPDVRVKPETLGTVLSYFEDPRQSRVGIMGIRLLDRHGDTARCCARRPTTASFLEYALFLDRIAPKMFPPHFLMEWDHLDTRPVPQVMGAFLIIRRDLFTAANGFDERFFVYYEDLDLCLRVIDAGHEVVHFAQAAAVHDGGGTTEAVKDRRLFLATSNRVRFMHKWHGLMPALLLIMLTALAEMPIRLIRAASTRSFREVKLTLRGAWIFWSNIPRLVISLIGAQRVRSQLH